MAIAAFALGRKAEDIGPSRFNCGGYALGRFDWYCPHDSDNIEQEIEELGIDRFTEHCVEDILARNSKVRRLRADEELKSNERLILFRLSNNDFHFLIQNCHGDFLDKRGPCAIDLVEGEDPEGPCWYEEYHGPIVRFAITVSKRLLRIWDFE